MNLTLDTTQFLQQSIIKSFLYNLGIYLIKMWKYVRSMVKLLPLALINQSTSLKADTQPQNEADAEIQQIKISINKIFLTSEPLQSFNFRIFAFDAQILAKQVTSHLDITLGRSINSRFNDGEINIQLLQPVRDQNVFIIKSFENKNINDGVMELLFAVSCMKKQGAKTVTAIIPYIPYSQSSTEGTVVMEGDDFYTCFASDILKLLQSSGCDTIITLNSLMSTPKGFTQTSSFINIEAPQIVVPILLKKKNFQQPVIISSNSHSTNFRYINQLRRTFNLFGCQSSLGFFNQDYYIGQNVQGKDVLLYNNLLRTGVTMTSQVKQLKQLGARDIYYFGFHGMCVHDHFEKLVSSLPIEELIMTNSVFQANQNKKIRTISVAKLLAQLVTMISQEKSLREYRSERQMWNYALLTKLKLLNLNTKWSETQV